jgi:hypothetical protein
LRSPNFAADCNAVSVTNLSVVPAALTSAPASSSLLAEI